MKQLEAKTEIAVRLFLARVSDHYDMDSAFVFGSRARGTHRSDSDIDVAILLNGEQKRFLTTKLEMADLAYEVLLETDLRISPLPIWLDEWGSPERYDNPDLLRTIQKEGIAV